MNVEYRYSSKETPIQDAKYWLVTGKDYSLNDLVGSHPNGYCDGWIWHEMVHDRIRSYPHIPRAITHCTERSAECVKTKDGILSVEEISRDEMIKILKEFPDKEIPLNVILV